MAMIDLSIVTPCTRTRNLLAMHQSIVQTLVGRVNVKWIIVFDNVPIVHFDDSWIECHSLHDDASVFGNAQRDFGAQLAIDGSWIWFLDDDTLVHPDFATVLIDNVSKHPEAKAIIVSQCRFRNGQLQPRCIAGPRRCRTNYIDIA